MYKHKELIQNERETEIFSFIRDDLQEEVSGFYKCLLRVCSVYFHSRCDCNQTSIVLCCFNLLSILLIVSWGGAAAKSKRRVSIYDPNSPLYYALRYLA